MAFIQAGWGRHPDKMSQEFGERRVKYPKLC